MVLERILSNKHVNQDEGTGRRFSLIALLASAVLLAGCQSSAPVSQVPVEEPGGQVERPDRYPGQPAVTPSGVPGQYPGPYDRPTPEPTRPEEPPSMDAAIDAIEADAENYMAQQQWQKSIETAEHGLRLDRRNAGFYRILGESYRELGDMPQAQRFARQAQRYCRSDCGSTERLVKSLGME